MPTVEQHLARRSGIEERATTTGAILVDMNTGRCFKLNRVGAEAWSLLGRQLTVDQICSEIAERYRLSVDKVAPEIAELMSTLMKAELVESVSPRDR